SASFDGMVASAVNNQLSVAFDPSDPSLYVRVNEFAFGGSVRGEIPFMPKEAPPGVTDQLFGNLYAKGTVQGADYPVELSGEITIGLDAKHIGTPMALTPELVSRLLHGRVSAQAVGQTVMDDLAIGINGRALVGYDKAGFHLSLPVAEVTATYQPGTLAFR